MGIQKSVFWDDLAVDLENPDRLDAFIKESLRIETADNLANKTFTIKEINHPIEDRLIELSELEDGWLDGDGVRISGNALEIAHKLSLMILDTGEFQEPSLFPLEDGGIQFQWFYPESLLLDSEKSTVYHIEVSPWGELAVSRVTMNEHDYEETFSCEKAIQHLLDFKNSTTA